MVAQSIKGMSFAVELHTKIGAVEWQIKTAPEKDMKIMKDVRFDL